MKSENLVVLDCGAVWCGPYRLIAPKISQLAIDYPQVNFYNLDVEEVPELAADLGVGATMPAFFFFKNGVKVGDFVGANLSAVKAAIEKYNRE